MTMVSKFFAGVLLANAVPHGVSAVQGRQFPSPFASPPGVGLSGPVTNAAWSAVNAVGGAALLGRGGLDQRNRAAVTAGAVAMGFFLAHYFGKNSSHSATGTGTGAGTGADPVPGPGPAAG
ncbi:hypothetical protein LJ753_05365 [Arthrobacter sp. zg-Y20]|uniref:hypothetical protein n=1 Tax=unclassified Arthrobacter TaxID=235627 RepID=UPI001D1584AE|nr:MULTISPECIES: hypothetical protein [unclassified Arthrobacter]MCC3275295.1 hypothetical protein [Arthrobacter sp. zg-Y20]MDK1315453.1 hypothetical protein [Arthrobacter sp. zg.Y20]WIB05870.1 hypothetical protein QNO06_15340 [Arthrobacter sp. zg-Y20]